LVHFIWPGIKNKLETDLKMWMNHTLEHTCPSSRSPRCNAGIYRFIPQKNLKKPNLGDSQMKTVFSGCASPVLLLLFKKQLFAAT
jgi:hypothetical protein